MQLKSPQLPVDTWSALWLTNNDTKLLGLATARLKSRLHQDTRRRRAINILRVCLIAGHNIKDAGHERRQQKLRLQLWRRR